MINKESIEEFLKSFKIKVTTFGIIFRDDRGKNIQTLASLDITPLDRIEVLKTIEVEDYVQGPIRDTLNNCSEMWVFGKDVKGEEVYIKISLGGFNNSAICISFHIAEFSMNYPLKK